MKSIARRVTTNQTIHKSLFINYLFPIRNEAHAMKKYRDVKQEHPDATHHCFAYVIGENKQVQKYADDGEPSRTAGFPMLEVLLKQDVTNVLAVTVRYYGGIKLGAGGLVRAYSSSVAESMKLVQFAYLTAFVVCRIDIPFDEIGRVEHFIRQDAELLHTHYDKQVSYYIELEESAWKNLQGFLRNQTNGVCACEILQRIKRYV